jgi:transcriptional regulator of NAD metabolism
MKKKLGEHCPKMVRWYGSSIEDQEFPIPGKMSYIYQEVLFFLIVVQCQEEIVQL